MEFTWQVCSRARLSRDARFDGKFFIGVRSTGIYCRSICPSPTAKEENVRYFPTAAAAAEAGFRPCLRCRPECSPGTPAWFGTSSTVSRALRLIDVNGLESGGVDFLAEQLGVGARHLRRLFLKHLGATPHAVAQTRRLHFAKKLIDETNLPMTQVALSSGFGCVRRFNAEIRKVYDRTPTEIRSLVRRKTSTPKNEYLFSLGFRPPYAWDSMLAFLANGATPGVEEVACGKYRRSISLNDGEGYFEVSLDAQNHALAVRVQFGNPGALFYIVERIRSMFDLNADWTAIERSLCPDPVLSARMKVDPGLRIPGCWSGFETVTRTILGQQISFQQASAIAGKLARSLGKPCSAEGSISHLFPTPKILAYAELGSLGLPREKVDAIRSVSRAVCDGQLNFDRIPDTKTVLARLAGIRGIGNRTLEYVAMRALGEPDAFPCQDTGVSHSRPGWREVEKRAEAWRPWRAYAAMYLWNESDELKLASA